jgi:hypothetical protein|nr:MAG TPA: hypothetical protein [Caudoviricetes sp.]
MMDALKFIEERNRMCDRYWQVDGDCDGCPLVYTRECNELRNMVDDAGKAVMEAVEIVEKWSKEHPRKTRQSVFLEQWPNCMIDNGGIVGLCPRNVDKMCACNLSRSGWCADCRREFWMQEVE